MTSYTKLFCKSKKHTLLITFKNMDFEDELLRLREPIICHILKVKIREPKKFCSPQERIIILNKILIYNLLCSAVQQCGAILFSFFLMPVRIDSLVVICLQIHGYYISSANRVEKPSRSPPISAFALEWLLSKLSIRSI